jgi:hypothetical protein
MLTFEETRIFFRYPKDNIMQTPEWLQPGLYGAACGAVAPAERVAAIKTASSWNRGDLVLKNGWATMPGSAEGNSQVAKDCADKIAA